jgi:hypothetical protein
MGLARQGLRLLLRQVSWMFPARRMIAGAISVLLATSSLVGCAQLRQLGELRDIQSGMHALAVEAAIYGVPIVAMYNLRNATSTGSDAKVRPNEILRVENITDPAISKRLGFVTPNVNVLYGFGFMDLKAQPIILRAPNSHGRYYVIQIVDMWTNSFAYVGGAATGYAGGTYALVGPGWHGTLPPGVPDTLDRSPTARPREESSRS